jgi:hypothetical protein
MQGRYTKVSAEMYAEKQSIKSFPYPQELYFVFVLAQEMTNSQMHKLQNSEGRTDHISSLNFA